MPLQINAKQENHVAILTLEGSLTLGPLLVSLRQAARQSLAAPNLKAIVLDVTLVKSVDSSGLGELTIVYTSASRRNCPMYLVGVSANLKKMLEMTHLDGILDSAPELASVLRELQSR